MKCGVCGEGELGWRLGYIQVVDCLVSVSESPPNTRAGSLCEEPGGTGKQSVVGRSVWVPTHLHGAAAQAVS